MTSIDYSASAEVYANSRGGPKRSLFYRKFPSVAEAVQFVVEGLPAGMINVLVETEDDRLEARTIRELYDADDYPLPRSDPHMAAAAGA